MSISDQARRDAAFLRGMALGYAADDHPDSQQGAARLRQIADNIEAAAKVRALREGDGGRPFTGSIPKHAKWCQPGDRQDKRMFIVRFDDQDRNDAVFEDEAEAREFYARATVSWNCYLFGALPAFPDAASPIPATGGEKE